MGKGQNYGSQKRQKEIAKQKKKQEKAEKKRARKEAVEGAPTSQSDETDDESDPPSWRLGPTARKPRASRGRAEQRPEAGTDRTGREAEPRPAADELDKELRARLQAVCDEGSDLWHRFDTEVRQHAFHPFVPADYAVVLDALIPLRAPGLRFLEWGSATGVITIMADMLGFDAYGIEIDSDLVTQARELARRTGSGACFTAGSFVPTGYRWRGRNGDGDGRLGTIGHGDSGYLALGRSLDDFDLVFGYPWEGEAPVMFDVMKVHGREDARLLVLNEDGVNVYKNGRLATLELCSSA